MNGLKMGRGVGTIPPWFGARSPEPGVHVQLSCVQDGWYHLVDSSGWVDPRYAYPHEGVRSC